MSSLLTCAPGAWIPFQDPDGEETKVLIVMKERIRTENLYKDLNATEYELKESNMRRIIRESFFDVEVALNTWLSWVQWRHENKVESITEEEVAYEMKEGVFAWRGKNKDNMLCCVVTGRMFKPNERQGTSNSFKKYVLKTVEDGLKAADASEQEKICVIYDRRGMEYENIDPNMYQFCKRAINEMTDFYRARVGVIYVIHTNWLYWLLYTLLLRPLVGLLTGGDKIIVVEKPNELLEYFDEDQLLLLSYKNPNETETETVSAAGESEAVEPSSTNTTTITDAPNDTAGSSSSSSSASASEAPIEYSDNIGALITKGDRDHIANANETIRR